MQHKIFSSVCFSFCILSCLSSMAQKDTLMWFVGKWKDKKTFLIEKNLSGGSVGGGTVTMQPNGDPNVNTPDNKKWNDKIDEQVKEIEQTEEQLKTTMHTDQNMIQYNLGKESIDELERVKKEIKGYKAEPAKNNNANSNNANTAKFAAALNSWCIQAQADYKEVMDYYQSHRNDKSFNLPPPPSADYTCWSCDKNKREDYEARANNYVAHFFDEEGNLIKKALSICRSLELIGRGEGSGGLSTGDDVSLPVDKAFNHNNKNPSKNGPCYGLDVSKLWEAVYYLVQRGVDKANQLLKDNKDNYAVLTPVVKIYLSAYRSAQLLGLSFEPEFATIATTLYNFYQQQKNKLIKEKDYSQISNIPFMLGLLRQVELLGLPKDDGAEIDELLNFCHFKITIEMDIKVGEKGGYMLAHLKGSAKVVPELDSLKCLRFSLDKDEKFIIKFDIIANEFVTPAAHPVYVGTRQAETPMPNIDIHFCKEGGDSIYLIRFVPYQHGSMMWSIPQGSGYPGWINGLDNFFANHMEMVAEGYDLKNNPQKIAEAKQKAEEFKKKVLVLQQSGASPQKMAEEMKKIMEKGNEMLETPVIQLGELKFPVHLQKGGEVLINEKYDAKQINPKEAAAVVYGYFTIKLEHDLKK